MTKTTPADELAWGDAWLAWDTHPGFVGDEAAILRIARHREAAEAETVEKIVAWLMREEEGYPSSEYSGFAAMIREEIEAGEWK